MKIDEIKILIQVKIIGYTKYKVVLKVKMDHARVKMLKVKQDPDCDGPCKGEGKARGSSTMHCCSGEM